MAAMQSGYLVLADIAGFTAYLAGSELDHANDILGELLELVAERFAPHLTVVEFEGDCVYARAEEAALPGGEALLEILEITYLAFRDRVEAIRRGTTCQCNACRLIPTLHLKFIVHFGEYVLQSVGGAEKPMGSPVNLVHRLSKNGVTEETGWRAYILLSEAAVDRLGLERAAMHRRVEQYEHLGEVVTYSFDLAERYRERAAARRVMVTPQDAHATISVDMAAAPAVVWEWLNDPQKRLEWQGMQIESHKAAGRRGMGAANHCLHGKNAVTIQTILDWRPFEYFTHDSRDSTKPAPDMMLTYEITPIATGSRVDVRMKLLMPGPDFAKRMMAKAMLKRYRIADSYWRLAALFDA
jgi:class 3 adenylate cyclase